MKKIFATVLLSLLMLLSFSDYANAASCTVKAGTCNDSCVGGTVQANGDRTGGTKSGLVPCGVKTDNWSFFISKKPGVQNPPNNNGSLTGLVSGATIEAARTAANERGTATYGSGNYNLISLTPGTPSCRCELYHVFTLGLNLYTFIIWDLALPIAGILIVFGGVLLLVSGINPKWHDLGNQMLWGAAIGLGFIFGSWLIVNIVLRAIGYQGNWFTF